MSPATSPPPAPAVPAKPVAAGTTPAPAPAKAPATAPAPAAPVATEKKAGGKLADRLKGIGSSVGGKTKGLSAMPKKTKMILVVVVVLVLVLAGVGGVVAMRAGKGGAKTSSTLDMAKLPDWSQDITVPTTYIKEGTATTPNSMTFDLSTLVGSNSTFFVTEVSATLKWQDEANQRHYGRVRVNQPDTFQLEINSTMNASAKSDKVANDVNTKLGSIGPITMTVSDSGYTYFIMGNSSSLKLPSTVTESTVTVVVYLYEAQDLYASGPAALKWNDFGNNFDLTITVKGKQWSPEVKVPAKTK